MYKFLVEIFVVSYVEFFLIYRRVIIYGYMVFFGGNFGMIVIIIKF